MAGGGWFWRAAVRAEQIRDEMIEVIMAWRRGRLLPKAKAPMLLGLLSEFGPVRRAMAAVRQCREKPLCTRGAVSDG
jgi:hypothetical protein